MAAGVLETSRAWSRFRWAEPTAWPARARPDQAITALKQVAAWQLQNADVWAHLAELQFGRGDWDGATESVHQGLKSQPEPSSDALDPGPALRGPRPARAGERRLKWFIDHYNAHQGELAKNADALLLIGQAAERYYRANARGEELKDQLVDVMSELYEGALRADANCWQAPWLIGRL